MSEKMMESNEVEELVPQNDLLTAAQRPNRDTSDHLDENLEPIPFPTGQDATDLRLGGLDAQLPPGVVPPTDLPEGFDPSTLEQQDDGQFCVYKTIPVEGLRVLNKN